MAVGIFREGRCKHRRSSALEPCDSVWFIVLRLQSVQQELARNKKPLGTETRSIECGWVHLHCFGVPHEFTALPELVALQMGVVL